MVQIITGNPADYCVGALPAVGFDNECREFVEVMHVTHAFRTPDIARGGAISGRLVYDNSALKGSRTHVAWVSPNFWHNGFRYGTVGFSLDWSDIVSTRRAYWVEVALYRPAACRILLTDQPQTTFPVYDPTARTGPWWHDTNTNKHYYNSNHCLEFMIEGDISLEKVSSTKFVDHHADYCSENRTNPAACADRGRLALAGGARLLGRIIGSGEDPKKLKVQERQVRGAWDDLRNSLAPIRTAGTLTVGAEGAASVAASVLWYFGTERDNQARQLLLLFATPQDALDSLRACVESAFGIAQGILR